MSLLRVILRELAYRRSNFALAVLAVAAATGCVVGAFTLLAQHDRQTTEIVAAKEAKTAKLITAKEAETKERAKKLEDDYRKIMRELGFNLLILPQQQSLAELYADDFASQTMPEEYAERLAKSRIATINHILPQLQRKVKWTEQERTVIVIGVRGELAMAIGNEKKPLLEVVPSDSVVLGYELHRSLKLKVGDKITLQGHEFIVSKLHPERGNKDDISLWIPLATAQAIFNEPGRINAILALECNCATDRLAVIRADVAAVLPDTQVIELSSQALTRAEARNRAAMEAKQASDAEIAQSVKLRDEEAAHRHQLRGETERLAAILAPLVIVAALLAIASLAFSNARDRAVEVGALRAIGWRSGQVLTLFLGKAVLIGAVGAGVGCLAGLLIGNRLSEAGTTIWMADPGLVGWVLLITPVLTVVATWLPALRTARQDPALILARA